ncbi:MAG: type III-A CRISPR-associated protein Csm2 [Deltaproteobacteria bacterium]|nr:type III-A CRISPR-associated protein Csm2 [Deltaproteobacteria bacterium]MBW2065536.1 type III-A CRISPR-associated protein Csm2 [Deltaproteobacteria bacterium]
MSIPDKNTIKRIIDGDTKLMVRTAKDLGVYLKNRKLTTSQIRNVFSSVKKIEMGGFQEKDLLLLKPKLAYAASRLGPNNAVEDLGKVLGAAISAVNGDQNKFLNFCDFFEAILCYFRAAEKNVILEEV